MRIIGSSGRRFTHDCTSGYTTVPVPVPNCVLKTDVSVSCLVSSPYP